MSETGHDPESFPDKIIFASMLNDIANSESNKEQTGFLGQTKEVAISAV